MTSARSGHRASDRTTATMASSGSSATKQAREVGYRSGTSSTHSSKSSSAVGTAGGSAHTSQPAPQPNNPGVNHRRKKTVSTMRKAERTLQQIADEYTEKRKKGLVPTPPLPARWLLWQAEQEASKKPGSRGGCVFGRDGPNMCNCRVYDGHGSGFYGVCGECNHGAVWHKLVSGQNRYMSLETIKFFEHQSLDLDDDWFESDEDYDSEYDYDDEEDEDDDDIANEVARPITPIYVKHTSFGEAFTKSKDKHSTDLKRMLQEVQVIANRSKEGGAGAASAPFDDDSFLDSIPSNSRSQSLLNSNSSLHATLRHVTAMAGQMNMGGGANQRFNSTSSAVSNRSSNRGRRHSRNGPGTRSGTVSNARHNNSAGGRSISGGTGTDGRSRRSRRQQQPGSSTYESFNYLDSLPSLSSSSSIPPIPLDGTSMNSFSSMNSASQHRQRNRRSRKASDNSGLQSRGKLNAPEVSSSSGHGRAYVPASYGASAYTNSFQPHRSSGGWSGSDSFPSYGPGGIGGVPTTTTPMGQGTSSTTRRGSGNSAHQSSFPYAAGATAGGVPAGSSSAGLSSYNMSEDDLQKRLEAMGAARPGWGTASVPVKQL